MLEEEIVSDEVEEVKAPETEEEGFVKDSETVAASKHNQTLRKLREAELEKRELRKQLEDSKNSPVVEEDEEDLFKDEDEKVDPAKLIDEKLKPVLEANKKREENDKKIQRTAFFSEFPEYGNSEKFQELLDVLDDAINPNSNADYITQLRMAHSILSGNTENVEVEDKKKEIAGAAASGGDGAEKDSVKDEFTAEDRKHQKMFNVSDEGMKSFKEKQKTGAMRILT
jgi:hypothetical protein